jgi:hypothetical protein
MHDSEGGQTGRESCIGRSSLRPIGVETEAVALRRRRRFPRDDASIAEESGRNVPDTRVVRPAGDFDRPVYVTENGTVLRSGVPQD